MTKNLETADSIAKLALALMIITFHFTHVISGPLATFVVILAFVVILIFTVKLFLALITKD